MPWVCQCQNVNQDTNTVCPKCQRSKTSGYSKSSGYSRDESNNGFILEDIVYVAVDNTSYSDNSYSSDSSSSSSCDSSSSSSD